MRKNFIKNIRIFLAVEFFRGPLTQKLSDQMEKEEEINEEIKKQLGNIGFKIRL